MNKTDKKIAGKKDGCYQGYDELYVILLSKIEGKSLTKDLIKEHVQFLQELEKNNKLVLCGPFSKASSINEAQEIAYSDPFVKDEVERCEIRTWQLSCESNNHLGVI